MWTIGKKIKEEFENFRLWFLGEALWNFGSYRIPYVNENENIRKKFPNLFFFQKVQNMWFLMKKLE